MAGQAERHIDVFLDVFMFSKWLRMDEWIKTILCIIFMHIHTHTHTHIHTQT